MVLLNLGLARAVTSTPANARSAPSQRPARKLLALCLPSLTYHPRSGSALAPRFLARVSIGSRSRRALARAAIGCTHTRPSPPRTDRLLLANLIGALSIIISTPHTDPSPPQLLPHLSTPTLSSPSTVWPHQGRQFDVRWLGRLVALVGPETRHYETETTVYLYLHKKKLQCISRRSRMLAILNAAFHKNYGRLQDVSEV